MIFNIKPEGQLGNRLFHAAHLIVLSIETEHTYFDFTFEPYKDNFKNLERKNMLVFPESKNNLFYKFVGSFIKKRILNIRDFILYRKIDSRFLGYINQENSNCLNFEVWKESRKKYKNYLIEGWVGIDLSPLHLYRNQLKTYFEPTKEIIDNVRSLIENAHQNADLLIGIHMRRGDFKEYRDGLFYFEDEVYIRHMQRITELFKEKKIVFYLTSNEPIQESNFSSFNIILANNQIVEDMYCLSECDYIIGPVSTYSMWASFIGEKPLCQLMDRNYNIELKDFKIINNRAA